MIQMVVFSLDNQRYALPLAAVERIVRVVEFTSLPKAPPIVLGIVDIGGRIVPVVNVRKRFRLPEKEIELEDHLILGQTGRRPVALVVDEVSSVVERPDGEVIAAQEILPGLEYVQGVAKLEDGLLLIHDLNRFLSLEEEETLDKAMREIQQAGIDYYRF
ncbi:MAG: chemotaxis protein CheW [Acidobacteria bacterium RIFCSPLOWO2_12_FULL_60_22]|nr:MAG: chemotaxis protein CheW [Acidobacteria bacterium RIFCSPLOWO2_12_FULL_60_22]